MHTQNPIVTDMLLTVLERDPKVLNRTGQPQADPGQLLREKGNGISDSVRS